MLVAMTYSAELFLSIVAGLMAGFAVPPAYSAAHPGCHGLGWPAAVEACLRRAS